MARIFKEAQSSFKYDEPIFVESAKGFKKGDEWRVGDLVQTPWGKVAKITEVLTEPNENGYSGYYRVDGDIFCHLGLHLRKI
jgi:hypothetical protein